MSFGQPMAAYLMTRMYKGTAGKVEGGNFIEEIVPLLILYPFTLMWFYHYVIKKESEMIRLLFKEETHTS
jgi:hypothetical protein